MFLETMYVANGETQRRTNQFRLANQLVEHMKFNFLLTVTNFQNSDLQKHQEVHSLAHTVLGHFGPISAKVICKTEPPTHELTLTLSGRFSFFFYQ